MESCAELAMFEQDDVFSQFLRDEFQVKNFASQLLQSALVSELLPKLASGIALLDKELLNQVSTHYEDLLSQATGIETLEGVLAMMQIRIQTLLSAVERLRSKLFEPYKKISSHTAMLARLQTVCDILRRVVRIIYLTKRLHGQLQAGPQEITKVAQSLSELDFLLKNGDLNGLDVIEKEQQLIRQSRKEVERQADQMLNRGMETPNQTQIAIALQVFHNLDLLEQSVRKTIENLQQQLMNSVHDALNVVYLSQSNATEPRFKGAPGRASLPSVGSAVTFRANLWTNMEKLTNQIYSCCSRALHLQKVLAKKRDPLTQVCFLDELANVGGENILPDFWAFVSKTLKEEFNKAANESSSIRQAFEGEYPKLLRIFADLWKRLQHLSNNSQDSDESTNDFDPETALRSTLTQFEQLYLSRSLSRLFDPINIMFGSEGANPRTEDVNGIIRIVSSELGFALIDAELYKTIAKNVAKTINLFAVKWEQMICTDGEASQVVCPPTPGQKMNVTIINLLNYFNNQMKQVVNSLVNPPPEVSEIILQSLDSITNLMDTAVDPLLKSIKEAIEDIILTMHNEDYSTSTTSSNVPEAPCSLYTKELEEFIARAHSQYLNQIEADDFIVKHLHPLAGRSLIFLIRNVTLVRPLGSYGKMRLASDLAKMEQAISPLCRRASELGKPYRLLRSFKNLLFQNPEHIVTSSSVGEIISYSTVLNFLFSKAPPEMLSPHQSAHWSVARYCQWLDERSEREALQLIQGSLEAYARSVKERQEKEYASVYPIMLQLLQKGLDAKSNLPI